MKAKSNKEKLSRFLNWAENFYKKNNLSLNGFWTYDNDYFSWSYLAKLVKGKYLVLNKEIGKKPRTEQTDFDELEPFEGKDFLNKLYAKSKAKYEVANWYYKDQGKIFNNEYNTSSFKKTKQIINGKSKEKHFVHADWYGTYSLNIVSLAGRLHNEKVFGLDELYLLREFIEREKPKGAVISYVTSDVNCPIYGIDLSPILDLFDIPELKYLKLLFVSKTVNSKTDENVEFIVAYSK